MPTLYIVATPIGNLQDLTPRAVQIMREVDLIAAEDTRVTMKLLQLHDIHKPMTSCHRHNEDTKGIKLIERMISENINVAMITDAGTPCISDPGYALVREAVANGIAVQPVPGCCAVIAALSVCGFDTREFAFYGFLPRKKADLSQALQRILAGPKIAVLYESPNRIISLTEVISQELPDARLSLSCDLTKLHELTIYGSPAEILEKLRANENAQRGEYCLVMDLTNAQKETDAEADQEISPEAMLTEKLCAGLSLREAQEALCALGYRKNQVKSAALHLKKLLEEIS